MRLALAFAATIAASAALADVKSDLAKIDAALDKCVKADESNVGMKQCAWSAYADADKLLNQTYSRLSKDWIGDDEGAAERRKRLVAAQRAWVAFRDAECSLQATEMLGGSGEGLVQGSCLYGATTERAKALETLMKPN